MKKRLLSLLLALCTVFTLLPVTALAASRPVNTVNLTLTPPAGGMRPTDASIPADASTIVTDTRWEGTFLSNGNFTSQGYGAYVTVRIKDGLDKVFTSQDKFTINVNGEKNKNGMVTSVSADQKEIVIFVDFNLKRVPLGVTGGMEQLAVGDSLARPVSEEKTDQVYQNITVRSIPESPDGTVQPYSWVITEMDVRAKEGYLLTSVENALKNAGKKVVFNRYEVLGIVGDIEYKDPWNVHIVFYQWIGAAKGEKLTDQMKEWQKTQTGRGGNGYAELGTAALQDYLGPRLSSDAKKPKEEENNVSDLRAYAYKVPSMASGSIKWARAADVVTILDEHAETKFPGAVGQWYMIRQGDKVGYIPAAYVQNAKTTDPWAGAPARITDSPYTFDGGSGTKTAPYLISTASQLNAIRKGMDKHYKLTADIDLSAWGNWVPLGGNPVFGDSRTNSASDAGKDTRTFTGSLDGNGHVISGMTIKVDLEKPWLDADSTDRSYGLFSSIFGGGSDYGGMNNGERVAAVKDLGIVNYTIDVRYSAMDRISFQYAGALAGFVSGAWITNCYSAGGRINLSLTNSSDSGGARFNVGGLMGDAVALYVEDCYNTSSITVTSENEYKEIKYFIEAAGIAGTSYQTWYERCFNTGDIAVASSTAIAHSQVAGITANATNNKLPGIYHTEPLINTNIVDCYNAGALQGNAVSGILGYVPQDTYVSSCYNAGKLTGHISADEINDSSSAITPYGAEYIKNCGVNAVSGSAWQNSSKLGRKVLKSNPEDSLKIPTVTPAPKTYTAAPTGDKLTVNGVVQNPTVYKIDGFNYFKIRDLAAVLNGTSKQFAVGYDAASSSVTATSGQGYQKLSTDLTGAPTGNRTATVSNDTILANGKVAAVEVYKIDGNNYFKLRDLGAALGFEVGWDDANKIASIRTD